MWRDRKQDIYKKELVGDLRFQSHEVTSHCQLAYKILTFYLEQLLRNLLRKIKVLIAWLERKDNKYKEEQTGQSRVSIPLYNLSLFCIPNMNFLSYTVVEISLTKYVERKKKGHIQGRMNRRMPVLNPTI